MTGGMTFEQAVATLTGPGAPFEVVKYIFPYTTLFRSRKSVV